MLARYMFQNMMEQNEIETFIGHFCQVISNIGNDNWHSVRQRVFIGASGLYSRLANTHDLR